MTSLRVLGVIVNDKLTANDHVDNLLQACTQLLYALRVPRNHGVPLTPLHDVFWAIIVNKITYCAPAWSGFCSAADRRRLDNFLKRCKKRGFCDELTLSISEMFCKADDIVFGNLLKLTDHVLQTFLPERTNVHYFLRERSHNKTLINKTVNLNHRDFLIRMLYKDCY